MHTIQFGNYTIHHNGDFSGDIIVNEPGGAGHGGVREVARIPFIVMAAVVGEKIRREEISKLEEMDAMEVIYGKASNGW